MELVRRQALLKESFLETSLFQKDAWGNLPLALRLNGAFNQTKFCQVQKAKTSGNVPSDMCTQGRFCPACAFAQAGQNLLWWVPVP